MSVAKNKEAHLIDFARIGKLDEGFISIGENKDLPFEVKRVFWTYNTPSHIVRGKHAHYKTEQILIAVAGVIEVVLLDIFKNETVFTLDSPKQGLYIPADNWHTMQYSSNAVQIVMASTEYDSSDYIRDFDKYVEIYG